MHKIATKKLGLFGGTFDPIHSGHLHIAEKLLAECQLDQIRFIPCCQPVHRDQALGSAEDRLNMVRLAIEGYEKFVADDWEIKRACPSYTIDTVLAFKQLFPNSELFWILGADAANQFTTWNNWQDILEHCQLIITNRAGYELNLSPELPKTAYRIITIDPHSASATEIRQQLKNHQQAQHLPKKVRQYIKTHHLYNTSSLV